MKRVWIGHSWSEGIRFAKEVAEVLDKDDFDVELFGVSVYDKSLPDNYTIVDYGSRETVAMCRDGRLLDKKEVWIEECLLTILCNTNLDEGFVREQLMTNPELRIAASDCDWDTVFEILSEIENERCDELEM